MINIAEMTAPVKGANPSGDNLEYDPLYLEMDSLAAEVPDSRMGNSKIEGHGPDWKKLNKNCLNLWKRTRDLRVAAYLVISETAINGLKGFTDAFSLLLYLVHDLWDTCYPSLDPSEDEDPLERLNILAMLSPEPGTMNDPIMFISRFRDIRLASSLSYTLRDIMIANNELDPGNNRVIDPKLIHAELMRVAVSEIQEQADLARTAKDRIKTLCSDMNGKMKGGYLLTMASLTHEVDRLIRCYDTHLEAFNAAEPLSKSSGTGEAVPADRIPAAQEPQKPSNAVNLISYQVSSRPEALLLLRKGSEYFQRQEPNSPIPLLINRALRFAEMNFMDLLEDIAPDALSRGRDILGIKEEKADG
ncbi:MAG: type VI secretion system protein TssA [Treponema sp.]|jgi:type VI secretion system ImpA family protein|nr:type VI secretion system protein TssA [Treponema sp.]